MRSSAALFLLFAAVVVPVAANPQLREFPSRPIPRILAAINANPPPPVLPSSAANNKPAPAAATTINTGITQIPLASESGVLLTNAVLVDPGLDHLLAAVRALYLRMSTAPERLFNVSLASATGDMPPGTVGRISFSLDRQLFATNQIVFQSQPDRLQQPLNATLVHELVADLNASGMFPKALVAHNHQPGAWIVSPDEFVRLQAVGVVMQELDDIARVNYVQYTQMRPICLARYQLDMPANFSTANATTAMNATTATNATTAMNATAMGAKPANATANTPDEAVFLRVSAQEWRMARADVGRLVTRKLAAMQQPNATTVVNNATAVVNNATTAATATTATAIFNPDHFRPFILLGATNLALFDHLNLGYVDDWCWADVRIVTPDVVAGLRHRDGTATSNDTLPADERMIGTEPVHRAIIPERAA